MEVLADGTGKGYRAQVNERNQLAVIAESISGEGARATDGMSFILHARCHTAAAASGGLMHITNNESEYVLVVTRLYFDIHPITPTDLIVTQQFSASPTSGSDVSNTAIVQKNRGSAELFDLTVLISDGSADLTLAGGIEYHAFPVVSRTQYQRNMNETNILHQNDSIAWGWETAGGGNATDGEIISISANVIKRRK